MAATHTTAGRQSGRVRSSPRTEAVKRIRISFMHRGNIYAGSMDDIVAAGLATREQCPTEQGDPHAIGYTLQGRVAHCSMQNCGKGPEWWVSVVEPQPAICRALIKAQGDDPALDELLSKHLGLFYALCDFADKYPTLQTTIETNGEILVLAVRTLAEMVTRARKLFTANPEYQKSLVTANADLQKLYDFVDPILEDLDPDEVRVVLLHRLRTIRTAIGTAHEAVTGGGTSDWSDAVVGDEAMVARSATDKAMPGKRAQ